MTRINVVCIRSERTDKVVYINKWLSTDILIFSVK